jgi:hypothetical protein
MSSVAFDWPHREFVARWGGETVVEVRMVVPPEAASFALLTKKDHDRILTVARTARAYHRAVLAGAVVFSHAAFDQLHGEE